MSQETFNIVLTAGFIIIVFCIAAASYYLIMTLKSLKSLADSMQNTTEDIREKIQNRFISAIPAIVVGLIGRLLKRGG